MAALFLIMGVVSPIWMKAIDGAGVGIARTVAQSISQSGAQSVSQSGTGAAAASTKETATQQAYAGRMAGGAR
jgi:hypothetical protein